MAQPAPSLDIPTLVIHGTADPILPYDHGVALAKEIPGAELRQMEGVGHELPGEEFDVIGAILRHTQGVGARQAADAD